MKWEKVKLKTILTESKVESIEPNADKRITVRLNLKGVTKRPLKNDMKGATKYYKRSFNQFIYGKQNFFKGAFGIIPKELDSYETSSDLPCFDIDMTKCKPEWVMFFFKQGNYYKALEKLARGAGSKRISPKDFLQLDIPLPPLLQQEIILNKLFVLENKGNSLTNEIIYQQELLKKLRQSILQEAIEGKLTKEWREKNPDVESASVLLEKIKQEKEQLIKEKKIKKQKPLPPISEDEKPFEIPESWEWCRLGDTGIFERGKSKHRPRNDSILFKDGIYPFVQTGDVAQSKYHSYKINTFNKKYNEFGLSQSRLWEKGTFCITIAANIAETGFLDIDACFPDSVVGFNSIDIYIPKYIQYFFIISKEEIEKYAPATAQKNINLGIINELIFPLPPLSEMVEIVKKIENLFAVCDALEKEVQSSKKSSSQLMQAVLKEAFEG